MSIASPSQHGGGTRKGSALKPVNSATRINFVACDYAVKSWIIDRTAVVTPVHTSRRPRLLKAGGQ
jgi:hypothetical protein